MINWLVVCDMKPNEVCLNWYEGNPDGYTDDLGIIADCNQWIEYRPAGWYIHSLRGYDTDMIEWCRENLKSYQELGRNYLGSRHGFAPVICNEDDAVLFQMRWL